MASAVEASSRPLSLHVDTPPSSSPFPSPSSSFLPPPMPGAHEFAVKPPPRRRSTANSPATTTEISPLLNGNQSPTKRVSAPVATSPTMNGHPLIPSSGVIMDQPTTATTPTTTTTTTVPPLIPVMDEEEILSPTTPTPTTSSMNFNNHQSSPTAGTVFTPTISDPIPSSPPTQPPFPTTTTTFSGEKHKSIGSYPLDSIRQPISSPGLTRSASLSSQRPAPPSPAGSRRISTISLRSSTSKPTSTSVSRSNSQRHPTSRRQSQLNTQSPPSSNLTGVGGGGLKEKDEGRNNNNNKTKKRSTKVKIKIRDFAFILTDDRYRGMGIDVPKPNRFSRLNKKLGGSKKTRPHSKRWSISSAGSPGQSRSSSDNGEDDDDGDGDGDEDEGEGWFKRGMGRFSWSFGFGGAGGISPSSSKKHHQTLPSEEEETYPSRGDMERNFLEEDEHDEASGQSGRSSEVYYDAEDGFDGDEVHDHDDHEGEDGEGLGEEEPLFPGLYRAMFAFEPEGTAEMRLIEDQVLRVVGRGGGVGWAVVVVPDNVEGGVEVESGVRHALVPESYLEVVELD